MIVELLVYNKSIRTIKAIEPKLNESFEEQKKIYEYAYNDLKNELAPVKEELEELKKIKYFISKVMPAGTGGTAGDIFDDPDIESSNEPPSFKEQIKEAKQEAKEHNESIADEPHKKQNKSNPDDRDDD